MGRNSDLEILNSQSSIEIIYRDLMGSSTQARSIEFYKFRISRSNFWPMLMHLFRIFFFSQPQTYIKLILKAVTHGYKDQDFNFLCEKLLCLNAIEFCNQMLPILHHLYNEELCSQQQSFKLLELVTYQDLCKRIYHRLEIYASNERRLLQDQVQLGIGVKVQL